MTLLVAGSALAQSKGTQPGAEITYSFKYNGKPVPEGNIKLIIKGDKVRFQPVDANAQKELQLLDNKSKATFQQIKDKEGNLLTFKKPFQAYEQAELIPGIDTIMGYPCKKAKMRVRSNSIEVWYTDALPVKGTPVLGYAPGLGLVLKAVRNGNSEYVASKIDLRNIRNEELNWPATMGQLVDDATYLRQVIENRFTTINIFNQEQISWGNEHADPDGDVENVTYHYAGGTVIMKKVDLPDLSAGTLFAEVTEVSNGDAYDRTGSLFIVPTDKKSSFLDGLKKGVAALPVYHEKYRGVVATNDYLPTIELMRFFTPFGVKEYNQKTRIKGYQWADSAVYRQDITELQPRLKGKVWIGVFVGNYDKGGHKVSVRLKYYPADRGEEKEKKENWIMPIFNSTNLMEMAGQEYGTMFGKDSLMVTVNIPEGLKNLRLRYTSTGHGGWGGGDEFNPKLNEIFVDGQRVYHFYPWRTDCGNFRLSNPSSGNFSNGLSSSDLSRSNWCPGGVTEPVTIPLPDLKPGVHTFKIAIPLGEREGTSFSAWNVAGCLLGEK
ncbi:peptide-N-glycosidase [Chitinophaga sp. B61]|uniref:Peptide-N-glycosidase n=2 Tax=Chitinophaga rhizophila TaxID=2866212 RepID=A0ABS7GEI8_9BACT|nr:peptide-N-glycosidase [Chitinophaga rhizophila]